MKLYKLTDQARYSNLLDSLIDSLGGCKRVLSLQYESDYSGFVDVDVLLNDGRVMSYRYDYGSCSGCDEWESRGLSSDGIIQAMKTEATFFDNETIYYKFDLRRIKKSC